MGTKPEREVRITCSECGGLGHKRVMSGAYLTWLRGRRKPVVTIVEMGRRLGLSSSYLCDVEKGRSAVSDRVMEEYERLARSTQVGGAKGA